MNAVKEDILPTGAGIGSLTAHPTTVELDPDATGVSLRVTYITKHEVDAVLSVAEKIRQFKVQALDGHDDVPELEGVDLSYKAHQACAILNIQTSGGGDGIEKIRNHEGVFELPETKYSLLVLNLVRLNYLRNGNMPLCSGYVTVTLPAAGHWDVF